MITHQNARKLGKVSCQRSRKRNSNTLRGIISDDSDYIPLPLMNEINITVNVCLITYTIHVVVSGTQTLKKGSYVKMCVALRNVLMAQASARLYM
jgi:hypothetical protein